MNLHGRSIDFTRVKLLTIPLSHSPLSSQGLNNLSQTGIATSEVIVSKPTVVPGLSPSALSRGRRVVQMTGGEHHSLFLLSDGSVWGCGRCDGYELGLAEDHPVLAAGGEVDERRKSKEERWWEKKRMAKEKRDKAEETKRRRRASSISRAAAANRRTEPDQEKDELAVNPTQTQARTVSNINSTSQSRASETAIERALTKPEPISRTSSFAQEYTASTQTTEIVDEYASDTPPAMTGYVSQPVPIPFPHPPTLTIHNPPHPAWSASARTSPPEDPVVEISSGPRHNLALTRAGNVYAWGFSAKCALGLGAGVDSARVPTRVTFGGDVRWRVDSVSAGGLHCIATARLVPQE